MEKIHQIVVEVHDREYGARSESIQALLKEQGFDIATVEEELLQDSGLYNIYARRPERHPSIGRTELERGIEDNLKDWVDLLQRTAKMRQVPLLIGLCPPSPDMRSTLSEAFIHDMEAWIAHELAGSDRLKVLCFSQYEDIYNWGEYYDPVRDAMGHIPYTPRFFSVMSSILVRHLHVMNRAPYKVIALDCDNTLWAGVVGEDGAEGIDIRPEFRALQQFMLRQKESGMLLCLVSKNSEDDVRRVFDTRPDMVLKWEDIAGYQINWEPKSNNLQALSNFFNLSLDSFIFLDDSPVECAEVRAHCPAVLTLQLPAPADIPTFIQHIWAFDHERQTAEDSQRTAFYQQMAKREQFRQGVSSFADFIDGLALDIRIADAQAADVKRMSQMTQRTNQFNFVKNVLTVSDVEALSNADDAGCLVVRVADRFGDYGLCGLLIVSAQETALKMDTFLLSCRVMGRGVEHAMMAALGQEAEKRGKPVVEVTFVPSAKNRPAEQFLQEILATYPAEHDAERSVYIFPASHLAQIDFTPLEIEEEVDPTALEAPAVQALPNSDWEFMQRLGNERGVLDFEPAGMITAPQKQVNAGASRVSSSEPQDHESRPSPDLVKRHIEDVVLERVGQCVQMESSAIDRTEAFSEYGVDSMTGIDLIVMLNQTFDVILPPTTLFDYTLVG